MTLFVSVTLLHIQIEVVHYFTYFIINLMTVCKKIFIFVLLLYRICVARATWASYYMVTLYVEVSYLYFVVKTNYMADLL